jgi:hypothetical protein
METPFPSSKGGGPADPIDAYDAQHGKPSEPDVCSNPTNGPELGPKSFNASDKK